MDFESLTQRLNYHALTQSHNVIYTFLHAKDTEELTFIDLKNRVTVAAEALQAYCKTGDRALIILNPGFDFIVSFLACLSVGVIAVPLYPSSNKSTKKELIKHVIRDCSPSCIIASEDTNDFQNGQMPGMENPCPVILVGPHSHTINIRRDSNEYIAHPDDIAFLQYTSGTTGDPKGVMVSHANLIANQQQLQTVSGHTPHSVGVSWLPPYHDMGLIGGILQPLYVGFPVVLMAPATFVTKPIRWLQAISDYRATTSCAPNFAYELCVKRIPAEQSCHLDLSSLTVMFNGAEPISPHVIKNFTEHFKTSGFKQSAFLPCYGMAEATLMVTGRPDIHAIEADTDALATNIIQHNKNHDPITTIISCGYAADGMDIAIVDADTSKKVPDNTINEIWVKGPNVVSGYWNKPEQSKDTFCNAVVGDKGKWLRTGDLGFICENQLYISGRIKDLIIVRGKNYYPQDIEDIVAQKFPELRKNCIAAFSVGMAPDGNIDPHQEHLALVCEVERSALKSMDYEQYCTEISTHISKTLEIPTSHIALIKPASIPKTTSGKIRRFECRNLLLNQKLDTVHQWHSPAPKRTSEKPDYINTSIPSNDNQKDLEAWMSQCLANLSGESLADTSIQFDDTGIDSLGKATFVGDLSDYIGYDIPLDILNDYKTISDLSRYLASINEIRNGLSRLSPTEKNRAMQMLGSSGERSNLFEINDIPEHFFDFDLYKPNINLIERNKLISTMKNNPFFSSVDCVNNNYILKNGKRYINYSSNDFLGMSGNHEVQYSAIDSINKYGTGVSASRLISGEKSIHANLEKKIANFINTEDAIVFVGAATTNVSTIGHLFNENDLILYDELSHDSVLQGIRLSHATSRPFKHNDYASLDKLLAKLRCKYEKVLIFIEGLYSMDGDSPDLQAFIDCKTKYKCWLMVDECLSIGVLGKTGRGIGEEQSINTGDVDIWMGGLSKAFASCGGYIAGKRELIHYLKYTCPGFIFTTGISPANTAAASKTISMIAEDPTPVLQLRERAQLFLQLARKEGLNTGSCQGYSIVPVIIGNSAACLNIYEGLIQDGINVQPVLYPAVAENSARFRFSLTASHTEEQVRYTISCLVKRINACMNTSTETYETSL